MGEVMAVGAEEEVVIASVEDREQYIPYKAEVEI